jgi:uncharacterized protein YabN with tetrapyrrole methylase and pyrophosphatase domain
MKLTFVGIGIKGISEMTLRGIDALKTAKKVLSLIGDDRCLADLRAYNAAASFESVTHLYVDGGKDTENYQMIFDKIDKEIGLHEDVVFLITGHPRVGVSLVEMFEKRKAEMGLDLFVIEGISSFDTILNDIARDPLSAGSSIIDVNRLLLFDYQIEPMLDTYLYHVASIGNERTNISGHSGLNHPDFLMTKLLQFYPEDHPISFISSATIEGGKARRLTGQLRNLRTMIKNIDFWSTLFIPATKPKHINREFLQLMRPATCK